jgi:preprotein translocase subunit SecE
MNSILNYFRDVRAELSKVSWPTRAQTINYTLVVLGISLTLALFLGALDYALAEILNRFILNL